MIDLRALLHDQQILGEGYDVAVKLELLAAVVRLRAGRRSRGSARHAPFLFKKTILDRRIRRAKEEPNCVERSRKLSRDRRKEIRVGNPSFEIFQSDARSDSLS